LLTGATSGAYGEEAGVEVKPAFSTSCVSPRSISVTLHPAKDAAAFGYAQPDQDALMGGASTFLIKCRQKYSKEGSPDEIAKAVSFLQRMTAVTVSGWHPAIR